VDAVPGKGDMVLFCPPLEEFLPQALERGYVGRGFCPGGAGYLIKKIVAADKDVVTFGDSGILVNGSSVPNSARFREDRRGRPLPGRNEVRAVATDQVLLLSDLNQMSYDSRYFGLVERGNIKALLVPLLTWEAADYAKNQGTSEGER
jgi:conjugative transfer signal peptidase TraF